MFAFAPGEAASIRVSSRSIPGLHLRDALDLVAKRAPACCCASAATRWRRASRSTPKNFAKFKTLFAQVAAARLLPGRPRAHAETDGGLEGGYFSLDVARLLRKPGLGSGASRRRCLSTSSTSSNSACSGEKHLKLRLGRATPASTASSSFHRQPAPAPPAYRLDINRYMGVSRRN